MSRVPHCHVCNTDVLFNQVSLKSQR